VLPGPPSDDPQPLRATSTVAATAPQTRAAILILRPPFAPIRPQPGHKRSMPRPYAHGLRRCPRRAETRAGRPRQRFAGDTSPCVPPTWDATCYRCRVSR
jgi:hypothetical protein